MIFQTAELSPSQRAATTEQLVGPKFHRPENPVLRKAQVASPEERENAARQMRYQLYLLDRSERRMSIEEYAAALLEKTEMMA